MHFESKLFLGFMFALLQVVLLVSNGSYAETCVELVTGKAKPVLSQGERDRINAKLITITMILC